MKKIKKLTEEENEKIEQQDDYWLFQEYRKKARIVYAEKVKKHNKLVDERPDWDLGGKITKSWEDLKRETKYALCEDAQGIEQESNGYKDLLYIKKLW